MAKHHPRKKKDKHRHGLIGKTIGKRRSARAKAKNREREERGWSK